MDTYPFRREDSGEIVQLTFEQMMDMDVAGYVTLPDGTAARRVRDGSGNFRQRGEAVKLVDGRPWYSDSLGFGDHCLDEMIDDRNRHGFKGVDFVPDPDCEGFVQVRIDSPAERRRYLKHRGMIDANGSKMGVAVTAAELAQAEQTVRRRYGGADGK